jgi:hypothetical protein
MAKSSQWGHTKINLETQSKSERRKELKEIDKQEDKFNKLVGKLKESARQGRDKAGIK